MELLKGLVTIWLPDLKTLDKYGITVENSSYDLNKILDVFPELNSIVGKRQHGTHDFDVLKHSRLKEETLRSLRLLHKAGIDDFEKILMGEVSERLPHVVSSCGNDNIIVFWCGHGNLGKLAWGSRETVYGWQLNGILSKMNEAGKYRKKKQISSS